MWPKKKYELLQRVLAKPSTDWRNRRLTYWQTDIKNLHFVYQLLKYASDNSYAEGEKWFVRNKSNYQEWGLLDSKYHPTEAGLLFLQTAERLLAEDPEYFKKDVDPFELEYLFHKILYQTKAREVFSSVENVLKLIPDLHVDDFDAIVSLVRIDNSDQTLQNYAALSSTERKIVYNQLDEILTELIAGGGLNKVKGVVSPDWAENLEVLSRGALGHQGDGYYRAGLLFKAHILLNTLLKLQKDGGSFTLDQLYSPFSKNISRDTFVSLLKFEPQIKQENGLYGYSREATVITEFSPIEEKAALIEENEVQKIKSETLDLSEEEIEKKLLERLKTAERTPVITVPVGAGRKRTSEIRHMRDPKTSATMRLYFKDICQRCGFDGRTEFGVGISEVDHAIDEIADVQNNKPSNLVVLCPNCHEAKTKGILIFADGGDCFVVKNMHTGEEAKIKKLILN